jgi:hypothetical protein
MLNNKESTKIGSDVALLLASMVLPWAVWILADKAGDELVRLIATWLRTGLWFILWGFCVLVQVRWILDRHTILKARDHVLCTWLNISHVWAYARFGFCVLTPLAWLTYKPAWYWLARNDVLWPAPVMFVFVVFWSWCIRSAWLALLRRIAITRDNHCPTCGRVW